MNCELTKSQIPPTDKSPGMGTYGEQYLGLMSQKHLTFINSSVAVNVPPKRDSFNQFTGGTNCPHHWRFTWQQKGTCCRLRARRALTRFNDVPLRTRRALYSNSTLLVLSRTSLNIINSAWRIQVGAQQAYMPPPPPSFLLNSVLYQNASK